MAKTPNWTRKWDKEGEIAWEHDFQPMEVVVEDVSDASGSGPGENWEAWLNFQDEEFEYHNEDELQFYETFSTKKAAREFAVDWMRDHPEAPNPVESETLETVPVKSSVAGYELQQQTEEEIEYIGQVTHNGEEYDVLMQVGKHHFANRDPIYALEGIIYRGTEFVADFRPSSKTQYNDPVEAHEALVEIMEVYSPQDAVEDEMR